MKPAPTTSFESIGRATFLPGMVHMLELMGQYVDEFRSELEAMQRSGASPPEDVQPQPPKRGRPPKTPAGLDVQLPKTPTGLISTAGMKRGTPEYRAVDAANKQRLREAQKRKGRNAYGWAGMTAEERREEMKRRLAVGKWNRTRKKLSEARKAEWVRMTRAEQKARLAAMAAGKAKAQHVNGAA